MTGPGPDHDLADVGPAPIAAGARQHSHRWEPLTRGRWCPLCGLAEPPADDPDAWTRQAGDPADGHPT